MIQIDLVSDEQSLDALEAEWWDLFKRSATATPFQSPAWLLAWWRSFRPGALCTLAVRDETLIGLAPMYLEDGRLGRRLLPIGIAISDYIDLLVDDRRKSDALAAIGQGVRALSWDIWELGELKPGAYALAPELGACADAAVEAQSACPVLRWETGDDPLSRSPARKRRQIRRAESLAALRGDVKVQAMNTRPREFLSALNELHAARWRVRGQAGVLAESRVVRFHQDALAALSAADLARCYVLEIGGRPAAAFYGLSHRETLYAYLGGFAPEFAYESPGAILIARAMRMASAEGMQAFDFLRGQEDYKYAWGAEDRWNMRRTEWRRGG